ncbi:hypothetical protein ACF0H5_019627 [Mactra antiquata]
MENATKEELNEEFLLKEYNDSTVVTLIPVMVYVVALMIPGIVGNSFVCYFYTMKTSVSTNVMFIVSLAVYDLMVCCISMPFEIVELRFYYLFTNYAACKIGRFLNTFGAIGSALTLNVIAVDRFRRVCRPFDNQMGVKGARLAIGITISGAVLLSFPAFFLYKPVQVEIFNGDGVKLQGFDCTTSRDEGYSKLVTAFNTSHAIGFLVSVVILVTMYSMIGRRVYKTRKNAHGHNSLDKSTLRYTKMMLAITVVFVSSFLPYLILSYWRTTLDEYEGETMGNTELVAFNIGFRSYFLNSAINPLIYGLFNPKFRGFIFDILCPCRRCNLEMCPIVHATSYEVHDMAHSTSENTNETSFPSV